MQTSEETRKLMEKVSITEEDVDKLIHCYNETNETPFEGTSDEQKSLYTVFVELQGTIEEGIPSQLKTDAVEKIIARVQEWLQELANLLGRI